MLELFFWRLSPLAVTMAILVASTTKHFYMILVMSASYVLTLAMNPPNKITSFRLAGMAFVITGVFYLAVNNI